MKRILKATAGFALLSLGACTVSNSGGQFVADNGSAVTANKTPYDQAFFCTQDLIRSRAPIRIAVGEVKDYTGKFSNEAAEGGYKVTQGGGLMVISAVGKLSPQVQLVERFDTKISEVELALSKAQLVQDPARSGDGLVVRTIAAGMVQGSDYYIVGGITEVNYNIQSGGAELGINGIGAGGRFYVMNVAADLRLVETRTMKVIKTVSLQKQVVGKEVKANIFNFFGNTLVDFNAGMVKQEPLQLGVRSALEAGVLELVTAAEGVDFAPCRDAVNAKFGMPVAAIPAQQVATPAQPRKDGVSRTAL